MKGGHLLKPIRTFIVILMVCFSVPAMGRAEVRVGEPAPDFTAMDSHQQQRSLSDYKGKYVVLEWFNPECPFVKKHYNTGHMQSLQEKYTTQDVVWLTIDSSAEGNQGYLEAGEANQYIQDKNTKSTALLLDASGEVGRLYGAQTTPHMFIIDPQGGLVYQGAIDDMPSTDPEDVTIAKNYIDETLSSVMAGKSVSAFATKSYGCSVKY
jgi:peroxiredoxin